MKILDGILYEILNNVTNRINNIKKYQDLVFNSDSKFFNSSEEEDIYRALAYDLDYYEPNTEYRKEDSSFYGDEKLQKEIKSALDALVAKRG